MVLKKRKRTFLIVDGNMQLHKSHAVHGGLGLVVDGKRVETGVPYGVIRALTKMISLYGVSRVCVVFDSNMIKPELEAKYEWPEDHYRVGIYEEYKANRHAPRQEIVDGKFLLDKFLCHMGVTVAHASPSFEGDDVIAYVSECCRSYCYKKGIEGRVIVLSDDKDFNQLICEEENFSVSVHKRRDKLLDHDTFVDEFGFGPDRFVTYLALTGDVNDEIPGIRGIGPKKATQLLVEGNGDVYGCLSASQRVILKRNRKLIHLVARRRVVHSLQHNYFSLDALVSQFRKYRMVSFLRDEEQKNLAGMKPTRFIKEMGTPN